jgi:hypothetical protein
VCNTDTLNHHPTPRPLVEELVRRARVREFGRSESWLPTAALCPGVEPGYDTFFILDSVHLEWLFVRTDTAIAVLTSQQLGWYSGRFVAEPRSRADTLLVLRTSAGWRIANPFWNWYDAQEARRLGDIK